MEPFKILKGKTVPLDRVNIDTDQIIPKQFLKRIERTGFGEFLFNDWRFNNDGSLKKDFILNKDIYRSSSILLTGDNFGSGSSREHAAWALYDYGFRSILAPSFADIFYNNCFQNGLLPIILPKEKIIDLIDESINNDGLELTIDLESQVIFNINLEINIKFDIDPYRKYCMLNGLDNIGLTLQHIDKIEKFEKLKN
ncbi:MAG: 3-isopropylmalate dehydratase small subunit [Chloroflexi bacterium]|nr:3-isopropylmalate dehydratase small subunit [Chloroflexota bacterium]|tara:strand:+ start:7896 stop:8486 length:591 start_codon:yes stop_codon:yes gene_type:complete